jgi:aminopeptidase
VPAEDLLRRYAELVVRFAANVQPGQVVSVNCFPEHASLARAIAAAAYEAGARFVDVNYADQHVKRELIRHAPEEALSWSPPWHLARLEHLHEQHGALIGITGDPNPGLLADLPGDRVGQAHPKALMELLVEVIAARTINSTVVGCPTAGWAQRIFGAPDVDRLWELVAHAVRLDDPDPVAAWNVHNERLRERAVALGERRFDAIRFHGGGTDLTVGLLPTSKWILSARETVDGTAFVGNVPTEEVWTTPDPTRVDGRVRATRPLAIAGLVVEELELRFAGGRATDLRASTGEDAVRSQLETDAGAARLGEVALVDGTSRVGSLGVTFYDTLFDENAASHIALGACYPAAIEDGKGGNASSIHTDLMIGGPEVDVDGLDGEGSAKPLLRGGDWVLG